MQQRIFLNGCFKLALLQQHARILQSKVVVIGIFFQHAADQSRCLVILALYCKYARLYQHDLKELRVSLQRLVQQGNGFIILLEFGRIT